MPIRIVAGLVGFCLSAPFTHAEISPAEATAVARVFSEWDGSSSPGCALERQPV